MSEKQWIIQRYLGDNQYRDFTPRTQLLTRTQMIGALHDIQDQHPDSEFRGHNVANERTGAIELRPVMSTIAQWNIGIDTGDKIILLRDGSGRLATFGTQAEAIAHIATFDGEHHA